MAIEIRKDQDIKGITVQGTEHKLNQFADDTSLFSELMQEQLDNIVHKLDWFRGQSGLQISYEKTFLYQIGSLEYTNARFYTQKGLSWVDYGIKILGIFVTHQENIVGD